MANETLICRDKLKFSLNLCLLFIIYTPELVASRWFCLQQLFWTSLS